MTAQAATARRTETGMIVMIGITTGAVTAAIIVVTVIATGGSGIARAEGGITGAADDLAPPALCDNQFDQHLSVFFLTASAAAIGS